MSPFGVELKTSWLNFFVGPLKSNYTSLFSLCLTLYIGNKRFLVEIWGQVIFIIFILGLCYMPKRQSFYAAPLRFVLSFFLQENLIRMYL